MAVAALRSIVYKRLVAILMADPAVYDNASPDKVRSGTLIRLDAARGSTDSPVAGNKQFGDLPELVLSYEDADLEDFATSPAYGSGVGAQRPGTVNQFDQQFRITLTHKHARSEQNDTLAVAVLECLYSAGPSLGLAPAPLPYVMRGRVAMRNAYGFVARPLTGRPETTERQQTTYTFPVTVRWKGGPFPTQTT